MLIYQTQYSMSLNKKYKYNILYYKFLFLNFNLHKPIQIVLLDLFLQNYY